MSGPPSGQARIVESMTDENHTTGGPEAEEGRGYAEERSHKNVLMPEDTVAPEPGGLPPAEPGSSPADAAPQDSPSDE